MGRSKQKGKPAWCYYENDPANGKKYGKLYNCYVLNDGNNITPKGWHMPTAAEWQILIEYPGGGDIVGGEMKETGTTHWKSPNTNATNENGFSAPQGVPRQNE